MGTINLSQALSYIIIVLISIDVHELAHAIVADRLGDPTPRQRGELSLNPFVHMNQFGIVLLLVTSIYHFGFTFGLTHVNPANLKFGPQRGNAIVAIVGPLSNLVLAGLVSIPLSAGINGTISLSNDELTFLFRAMSVNIFLCIFNLLPIPPLDGFTVAGGFLSARQMYALAPLQQWGPLVVLVLFIGEPQLHILSSTVYPAVDQIDHLLCGLCPSIV
ncbi:MAG: site-2 protease family protein [Chloroflexota bacterium]